MKIKLITGRDKNARKKIDEILDIYNSSSGLNEGFTNDYPDKCLIAYVKGKPGGVIIETLFKGGSIIYYAGFAKEDRRRGYLKACIDKAKSVNEIYGVQVNPFDDFQLWHNLGFVNQTMVNFVITLINITPGKLKQLYESQPNNDNF